MTKSAVKIRNFREADQDLIITKWTNVTPLAADQITFPFSEDLADSLTGQTIQLSAIHNLAGKQIITVKGQVASASGIKIVTIQYSGTTPKQEVMMTDTAAV